MPLDVKIEDLKIKEWNNDNVLKIFKKLKFNRYIERFHLENNSEDNKIKDMNPNDSVVF